MNEGIRAFLPCSGDVSPFNGVSREGVSLHTAFSPISIAPFAQTFGDGNQIAQQEFRKFLPKVYFHKMGKRIELNHKPTNLYINRSGKKPVLMADFVPSIAGHRLQITFERSEGKHRYQISSSPTRESIYLGFKTLKTSLLKDLRSRLVKSSRFSIHDIEEITERKAAQLKIPSEELMQQIYKTDFDSLSGEQFLKLCTEDKELSAALQSYIAYSSLEDIGPALEAVKRHLTLIMVDKYGNFVVQHAIRRSSEIAELVCKKCSNSLFSLSQNKFTARVIYTLAEVSQEFRGLIFTWYTDQIEPMVNDMPSTTTLVSALSHSEVSSEFGSLRKILIQPDSSKLLQYKNFRRLVAGFFEKCDKMDLDLVFRSLRIKKKLIYLLDDSSGALIFITLTQREHRPTERLLVSEIYNNIYMLLRTKYFKLLFFKVVESQCNWTLVRQMHSALMSIDRYFLSSVLDCKAAEYFYCALLAITIEPCQHELLRSLASSLNHPDQLRLLLLTL